MPRLLPALALLLALLPAARPAAAQSEGFFAEVQALPGAFASSSPTATLPAGFYLETIASGLATPVEAAFGPGGRLVVAEKRGRLHLVENGARREILNIEAEVLNQGDRGLLGVVFDPGAATNGYLYLVYTVSVDGADTQRTDAFARLTRYTMRPDGSLDPASRRILIGETFATGIPACYYSHVPATLAFGRDGTLLIGTGDAAHFSTTDTGGLYSNCFGTGRIPSAEDVGAFRSQQLFSLAGKILRVDPATGLGLPSNPFFTGNPAANQSKVWALGFRNPYRFSVDPASGSTNPADGDPGLIYYADVGWQVWEEVGVVRRGENHAWPCREGFGVLGSYANSARGQAVCPGITPAPPTFAWHHNNASLSVPAGRTARATVGGAVYRGTRYPAAYRGRMYYADYPVGWMGSAQVNADGSLSGDAVFSSDTGAIVDIEYDPGTQTLNFVNVGAGSVQRLRHTSEPGNAAPVAQAGASVTQGGIPLAVQFSGSASFDPNGDGLTYAWAFGDGATSALADPAHTYTAAGTYTATLTVRDGFGATGTASVVVTARQGTPPTAAIVSPADGASALPGQTVPLLASATDPDQDPATLAYRWEVTLVHDDHLHPDEFAADGASAAYTVPFHSGDDEFYALLIRLMVTDADGLTDTAERLLPIGDTPEVDVTAQGTPVALVTAPTGSGSRNLAVIQDGVAPLPTATPADPTLQYDTFTGADPRDTDWIGYAFPGPVTFGRLRLTEGIHFPNGGWFETLGVQVRQGGQWLDVANLVVTPAYRGDDGRAFDAYDLVFQPVTGDGVRLVGVPGGAGRFISVAELRAFASGTGGTGALPAGWAGRDVGRVGAPGSAGYAGGTFTVRGGGDIWGDFDGFHYAARTLDGDGVITARLSSLAGAHPWAKAGLMIRDGDAGDAPHAMLIGTAAQGVHLQSRATAGAETDWTPGPADRRLPAWLRLQRTGNVLTGFVSADGQTWTVVGSATVPMGPTVSVGLVTTSTDYGDRLDLAAATFTDVTVSALGGGGALPAATAADVGAPPAPGATARDGTTFTVTGGGDVWGDRDAFHLNAWTLDGDGALTARLQSVSAANGWAKAGLMIRDGFGADAVQAFALVAPQQGSHLQYRPATGADINWLVGDYAQRAPVWLRLRRQGPRVTAETSPDGAAWTALGTLDLPLGATAQIGLAVTSSDIAGAGATATAVFTDVALSTDGSGGVPGLPEGWLSRDIGTVGVAGSTAYADGTFTVRGNGDLYGNFDGAQFAYQSLPGDAVLTARLDEVAGVNPWAKAGLMIRAGTGGAAPYLSLTGTPGRGVHVQVRTADGAEADWLAVDYNRAAPVWLRLQRAGATVSAFTSADGQAWTPVTSATLPLPEQALVGLVATATDYEGRNDLATARFSNVALGGTAGLAPPPGAAAQQAPPAFEILSVFPNPAADRTLIRLGIAQPGFYRVEIVDLLGRSVFSRALREDGAAVRDLPVDLAGRSAGVYLLRVEQEGGPVVTGRVTVMR